MKVNDNGIIREMTEAEIKEYERMQDEMQAYTPQPSLEDQVAALSEAVLALMGGGANV